ncbi:MAG: arginine--tRNA ligase [Planctomycetota bacterium]|nr:arginine--tRNA ligase [Planctomycetota bacterium]
MKATRDKLSDLISTVVKKEWDAEIAPEGIVDLTGDMAHGDLTTTAPMRLAKTLRQAPPKTAERLVELLEAELESGHELSDAVGEVFSAGGFVNFRMSPAFLALLAKRICSFGPDYGRGESTGRKVQVEFVSANPTGPLTVAHGRQAALGDTLANILSFAGDDVQRDYYLNDSGNQIRMLGLSVWLRAREILGHDIELPENAYRGDYIADIARKALDKLPEQVFSSQEQGIEPCGVLACEHILDWIRDDLERFGVTFDNYFSQRELEHSSAIDDTMARFDEKGLLYEKDGATWLKTSRFGDRDDRVVIKERRKLYISHP